MRVRERVRVRVRVRARQRESRETEMDFCVHEGNIIMCEPLETKFEDVVAR